MDALSDVLRVVGLSGGVFVEAEFKEPWYVAGRVSPTECAPFMPAPEHVVCFHYIIEGAFEIHLADGEGRRCKAGEIVILPGNEQHFLGSTRARPAVLTAELVEFTPSGLTRIRHGGDGPATRLVCGFLGGNAQIAPLLSGLPKLMVVDVAGLPAGDWMARTFSYAAQTLVSGDAGAATVLAKMSELLFVEALRRYLAELPDAETGWLAGLKDPVVGRALGCIHAQVGKDWTTDELADAVNLSRSAFADRFTQVIGVPPMKYLTQWRMQVAAARLKNSVEPIARIAYDVGYESEAAFARAFRREIGKPPGQWRRDATRTPAAAPA